MALRTRAYGSSNSAASAWIVNFSNAGYGQQLVSFKLLLSTAAAGMIIEACGGPQQHGSWRCNHWYGTLCSTDKCLLRGLIAAWLDCTYICADAAACCAGCCMDCM